MAPVIRFASDTPFKPGPPGPGGKAGRHCPRYPKAMKAQALGIAAHQAGSEEALERNKAWAAMGVTDRSIAEGVRAIDPEGIAAFMAQHGQTWQNFRDGIYNRVFRMFNRERKRNSPGMPDDTRGRRSDEHPLNWPDWKEYKKFYEDALQFGTRRS